MYLSVTMIYAAYLVYMSKTRCRRVLNGVFKVLVVWFLLKTLWFKSSGIICQSPLPSLLPDELPMDRIDSDGFFSTQRVCTVRPLQLGPTDPTFRDILLVLGSEVRFN